MKKFINFTTPILIFTVLIGCSIKMNNTLESKNVDPIKEQIKKRL